MRGVSVACGGTRSGADRRDEVEVSAKCRSHGQDVSDLVLETVEESCACGEDRVLVGLRSLTCKAEELLALSMSVVE